MASFAGFSFVALPWWVALIILVVCFTFVVITSIGSIGTLGFVLISAIIQLILINPSAKFAWLSYVLLGFVVTLIMYVHRGNIKRLFQGKENPTNIRAAFKKDFKLGKKDEGVEVLKGASEIETQPAQAENTQQNQMEPVKDVKIMSVETKKDDKQNK